MFMGSSSSSSSKNIVDICCSRTGCLTSPSFVWPSLSFSSIVSFLLLQVMSLSLLLFVSIYLSIYLSIDLTCQNVFILLEIFLHYLVKFSSNICTFCPFVWSASHRASLFYVECFISPPLCLNICFCPRCCSTAKTPHADRSLSTAENTGSNLIKKLQRSTFIGCCKSYVTFEPIRLVILLWHFYMRFPPAEVEIGSAGFGQNWHWTGYNAESQIMLQH